MNSIEKKLQKEILDYFQSEEIPLNSHFIIGFSGGPDSTALLYLLDAIRQNYPFSIEANYINHGLRDDGELKKDDDFIKSTCRNLQIPLKTKVFEKSFLKDISKEKGLSLEEVAREARYDFFKESLGSEDNYLLVGHNLDDQIETVATRFFQGVGFQGLKGIPQRNGKILRPLIHINKNEILEFLNEKHISYRTDSSNLENDFLRNKMRNQILPFIKEVFPGMEKSLIKQVERFQKADNLFSSEAESIVIERKGNDRFVDLHAFNKANDFVRLRILYKMFDQIYRGNEKGFRVPVTFFNPLLTKELQQNQVFARAYDIFLKSDKKSLLMRKDLESDRGFFSYLNEDRDISVGGYSIKRVNVNDNPLWVTEGSPLIARSANVKDIIVTEKKKIHIGELIKAWGQVPLVLSDSVGIIALWGKPLGFENFYRKKKSNASQKFNILYLEVETEKKF